MINIFNKLSNIDRYSNSCTCSNYEKSRAKSNKRKNFQECNFLIALLLTIFNENLKIIVLQKFLELLMLLKNSKNLFILI